MNSSGRAKFFSDRYIAQCQTATVVCSAVSCTRKDHLEWGGKERKEKEKTTHPSRDRFPQKNLGIASPSGKGPWDGRIEAECLVQAGQHVCQPVHADERDLLLGRKRRSDLADEHVQLLRMRHQQMGHAGEKGCRRLAAGRDQRACGCDKLLGGDAALGAHHAVDEVFSVCWGLQSSHRLVDPDLDLLLAVLDDVLGDEGRQDPLQRRIEGRGPEVGEEAGAAEDQRDPGMILAAGQAVERLAIRQVADDIKREELPGVSTEACLPRMEWPVTLNHCTMFTASVPPLQASCRRPMNRSAYRWMTASCSRNDFSENPWDSRRRNCPCRSPGAPMMLRDPDDSWW
ncbi:hypothetical protein VTN02DRAFT_6434 [Thermoascus thermophilus]